MVCSVEIYPRKRRVGLQVVNIIFILLLIIYIVFLPILLLGLYMPNIGPFMGFDKETAKSGITVNSYWDVSYNKEKYGPSNLSVFPLYKKQVGYQMSNLKGKSKSDNFIAMVQENLQFNERSNKNSAASKTEAQEKRPEKIAYLTFDDGPNYKITPKILKILDEYNIKATFFVLGELCGLNPEILKQEQAKGHLICNHTYSHEYDKIYASTDAFLKELEQCEKAIRDVLGSSWDENKIIRFPGGAFTKKMDKFKAEIKKHGYTYYNWNALNGDAEGIKVPVKKLMDNIVKSTKNNNEAIILMHDSAGKETTVEALPGIIRYLKEQGYEFRTLKDYENK